MKTGNIDFAKYNNKSLGITQTIKLLKAVEVGSGTTDNVTLLEDCRRWHESFRDYRERRIRNRKYYRGDQWSDRVKDPDSDYYITEETHIKNQGKVPLKQNIIRQIVKNLIGQLLSNPTKTMVIARTKDDGTKAEMLTNAIDAAKVLNKADDLDARNFEEFLLAGMPIQKVSYDWWDDRQMEDLYLENINPSRWFSNSDVSDIRLHDLRICGEIIDTTIDDVIATFAKTESDEKRIRSIYADVMSQNTIRSDGLSAKSLDNLDFYIPHEANKCRMYEIWQQKVERVMVIHDPLEGKKEIVDLTMKQVAEINQGRINQGVADGFAAEDIPLINAEQDYAKVWYVKFLTPNGHVLYEGKTPYSHNSHPYVLSMYPLLDGEVWGMIEDIIDQQRYINRLIIMMDFIISASAKGVLLVPEDSIPDDMEISDFADEWSRFNGVIKYKPSKTNPNSVPKQVAANSINIGIQEMLALQMNFMQEVSGVHAAIQGKEAKSGTPSSLYAQEAQNASINSLDYMKVFASFKESRDLKALKVITQFYKEKRYLAIAGNAYSKEAAIYDPEMVKDLDWDVRVTQGQDTPVFRQITEDILMNLLDSGKISTEIFLENSSVPFADKLLQSITKQKEQAMQGNLDPSQMSPELMDQVSGADPEKMALLQKAMSPAA